MPSTLIAAATAAISSWFAGFTLANAVGWALKAGALIGLQFLLQKRQPDLPIPDISRTETFSSGPARWVLGRAKVGGVIAFYAEDHNVPRTERGSDDGGADDLHIVYALSEDACDVIEAVFIAGDKFTVDFNDDAKTIYARRGYKDGDSQQIIEGLPLILEEEKLAYYHSGRDVWLDTNPYNVDNNARVLNPDDDNDAETIRIAALAQAINVHPYLDATGRADNWRSVRYYTARDWPSGDGSDSLWNTQTDFGRPWTTAHKLEGIAGVHVKLRQWTHKSFDRRVFRSGVPQVSFQLRGLRITYPDPADLSSFKTEWTSNAAAIRYWFHTKRRGIPHANIDLQAFKTAFEVCEDVISPTLPATFPGYPAGERPDWASNADLLNFPKYSINGVLASGERPSKVEAEFDDIWQGIVAEENGKLYYYPGGSQISEEATIDGFDILDLPSIVPVPKITERTNAVSIQIQQSAWHDFNSYALRDVVDQDKVNTIDLGDRYASDLGTLRWCINPAQASLVAIIALRRARASRTISVKLPPGATADASSGDYTRYLEMSIGKLYSVNIPQEGLQSVQMQLVAKQVNEDFTVDATFVDSPSDLYQSSYSLPALEPPPPYTPTKMGSRPRKPTGLFVESTASVNDDGGFSFVFTVSVDTAPLDTVFELIGGSKRWESPPTGNRYVFEVDADLQQFRIQARHLDGFGVRSLPAFRTHTPSYATLVLPRPRWNTADTVLHGANLLMVFQSEPYNTPIAGVEVRYTNNAEDPTKQPVELTDSNWDTAGTLLQVKPVQTVRGLDMSFNSIIRDSATYYLYARYVSSISGVTGSRGPISVVFQTDLDVPTTPVTSGAVEPGWQGASNNLYKWTPTAGDSEGYPLMIMSHKLPTGANYTARLEDIPFDRWNGNIENTSVTAAPIPAWLFGNCAGYDQPLDDTGHRTTKGLLDETNGGDSTWFTTLPIHLGTTKAVEVKAEVFSYAPGTRRISSLTFAGQTILPQDYQANTAIPALKLPEARNGLGEIVYEVQNLPSGVMFNKTTRVLSGIITLASGSGTMTYIARDAGGGEARITFQWAIAGGITNPITVGNVQVNQIGRTTARVTWGTISGVNYYKLTISPAVNGETVYSDIEATNYDLRNLSPNTTYSITIIGVNSVGDGTPSPAVTFTTLQEQGPPGRPTGLLAVNDNGIFVSWIGVPEAEGYEVHVTEGGSITATSYDTEQTSFRLSLDELETNTLYRIKVRAFRYQFRVTKLYSAFTPTVSVTTLSPIPAAPVIQSITNGTGNTPSMVIQLSGTVPSEQAGVEFLITADPPDGLYGSGETSVVLGGQTLGPFTIANIKTGHEYTVKAKTTLTGNRRTAESNTVKFIAGNVPPRPLTAPTAGTTTTTTIPISFTAITGATSYRIRYWETDTPTNIHDASSTSTSATITGLTQGVSYSITYNGVSSNGNGLPSPVLIVSTSGTNLASRPTAPTGLAAIVQDATSILLTWDDDDNVTTWEVRKSSSDTTAVPTNTNSYRYQSLDADTDYTMQIRAKNPAGESAWTDFPTEHTPPANNLIPYTFAANAFSASTVANDRTISYSFSAPVSAAVEYFQIRLIESDETALATSTVTNYQYTIVNNTYTSGTRTFTGTIDPGFSQRYYELELRAYLSAADGGTPTLGHKGFGEWIKISNTETVNSVVYNNVIKSGRRALAAPTITPVGKAGFYISDPGDFEQPTAANANEYSLGGGAATHATAAIIVSNPPNPSYPFFFSSGDGSIENSGLRTTNIYLYGRRRALLPARILPPARGWAGRFQINSNPSNPVYRTRYLAHATGDTFTVRVERRGGTWQGTTAVDYTYTVPANNVVIEPEVSNVEFNTDVEDVVMTWEDNDFADGYQVTLIQDNPNDTSTTQTIVQTSADKTYTHDYGRNENFRVSIRPYTGSASNPNLGTPLSYAYVSRNTDIASLPIITGLQASRDSTDTSFTWNDIVGLTEYGFETQYSTDNGSTWLTNHNDRYTRDDDLDLTSTQAPLTGDVQMRVRVWTGANASNPSNFARSWSTISFKAVGSNESGGGPGRIRQLVAIPRDGTILLDWTPGTGSFSRYHIQSAAPAANPSWADLATNVSTTTTQWKTTQSAYANLIFRIREQTDESNGDWTYIRYTAMAGISIGAISTLNASATYTSMHLTWTAASSAESYEVQYKKHSVSNWETFATNDKDFVAVIAGLDPNTRYNARVRGKSGTHVGAWNTDTNIQTLTCVAYPAPTGVDFSIGGSNDDDIRVTWDAVTGASGYEVRVAVGNTQHLLRKVYATSLSLSHNNALSSITRPANVSIQVRTLHSDCPAGPYSAAVTKEWEAGVAWDILVLSPFTIINERQAYWFSSGQGGPVNLPQSFFMPAATSNFVERKAIRWHIRGADYGAYTISMSWNTPFGIDRGDGWPASQRYRIPYLRFWLGTSVSGGHNRFTGNAQTPEYVSERVTTTETKTTIPISGSYTIQVTYPREFDADDYGPITLNITPPDGVVSPAGAQAKAGAAGLATSSTITLNTEDYEVVYEEPPGELTRPQFLGSFDHQIWTTATAIDYELPPIVGGGAPYKVLASGLPGGLSYNETDRKIEGTITNPGPETGYITIQLIDSNDLQKSVYLPYSIATTLQPTPAHGSGFGLLNNPYTIHCILNGNVKGYIGNRANAGTNAEDIINNTGQARQIATWFRCPVKGKKLAKLLNAATPDFDLIVKVGDSFYPSDTTDDLEFIEYDDTDETNTALIGVYRYSATTTSSGLDAFTTPVTLQWTHQVETPTAQEREVGGAIATGHGYGSPDEATGANVPEGFDESDIYVLYRQAPTPQNQDPAWTRVNTALGSDWTRVPPQGASPSTAGQICFEWHGKKWRNRALRRFHWQYRDI